MIEDADFNVLVCMKCGSWELSDNFKLRKHVCDYCMKRHNRSIPALIRDSLYEVYAITADWLEHNSNRLYVWIDLEWTYALLKIRGRVR